VENLYMESPTQWPLWLGPAQTAAAVSSATSALEEPSLATTDASSPRVPNPCDQQLCSLCWPTKSGSTCQAVPNTSIVNFTLSNVTINNPHVSPGVMLADPSRHATMDSIVFDHVLVVELPTWTTNRNSTPPLHPYAHRLTETFPGLLQPLRDKYVPNNSDIDKRDQQAKDGSYDNDDAVAVDSSTPSDRWYWAAMTCTAALSALVLVFSPLLWTLVVTAPSGDAAMTIPAGDSSFNAAEAQPLSSSHGDTASSSGPDAPPSTATHTKRVRFASGDDETSLMVGGVDLDHDPASSSSSSLTVPLLDPQRDASAAQLGLPPPSSSTAPNPTTARRVANTFRWTHGHWVLMLAMLTSVGLITWCVKYYMIHSRANSQDNLPAWDRTDRYYACQGLAGIARGGTWPVPSCFNQRPSQWWVLLKHLHGVYLWIAVGCAAAALLVASVALAWRYCKRRDRFRPFHEWRSIE
jgi:hypothetical protein